MEKVKPKQPDCLANLKNCKASCCRNIVFKEKILTDLFKEYYKAHGCKVEQLPNRTYRIVVPMKCPHLTDNKCDIHNNKPMLCRRLNNHTKHQYYITDGCVL